MDILSKELGIPKKNIFPTTSSNKYTVVVHSCWLKKWLKNYEIDSALNNADFTLQPGESVPYPWQKVFITVLSKKMFKVLPLPRYKLNDGNTEFPFTFSQMLQYVSHNNHRNLWKESYKKYCQSLDDKRNSSIVNLMEHDQLLTEIILRLYGCNIIRIKKDSSGKLIEYKEVASNKYISKSYEPHVNLLSALFTLETDNNFYIVHRRHFENCLLDCLNFSPSLFDMNYTHSMFIIYQLLNVSKALNDRGLSLGPLSLENIYLTENLWLQIVPTITNNIHVLDPSLVSEHSKIKQVVKSSSNRQDDESRSVAVQLETLCFLWVRGRISNLDYLLHLNRLAGRSANDPQAHYIVPWVTDFSSRCGKNWRDLTKSKYRLTKGDRQLDMTYEVTNAPGQIPHHVSDILSDITCYVYLARRTPKEVLCKHVRNKWVPAEYPASIQRMQEWTPDECVPEFYTDPTVFKSIHEDLPDLGVPSWATCVEDFITKHREALESTYVSENLHHWIDLTFGYKLSGTAAVKHKNVCLSLVDGHVGVNRGCCVPLLSAPHPPSSVPRRQAPPTPSRHKKPIRTNDTSEEMTDEDDESSSLPQHISRLNAPSHRIRPRHKSSARARSLSKTHDLTSSGERASSHTRHSRPQETEQGKTVIYLPKDFNPIANIQAIESLDNFTSKSFYSKAQNLDTTKDNVTLNTAYNIPDKHEKVRDDSEGNSFTNQMFLASYEQSYLKKFTPDAHLDVKSRNFNSRYTTDVGVYKQFVIDNRKQDMLAIGCLIVEICLHKQMRPLRCNYNTFNDRYNTCRTVLKYNFDSLPKCVRYMASLLLDVQPPSLSFKNELTSKENKDDFKTITVTDKGLPPPTPSQLLQPLLMQHLIPFPKTFKILHNLLSTLHEYEMTNQELNILYNYECDGHQCENYQSVDKTKLGFSQKIAEGKIQACATHLELILNQINCYEQFDVIGIFLTHYTELLQRKETSILAAWYLFDVVSKSLGPENSRKFLLKHILNLYEDDDLCMDKVMEFEVSACKQKFIKLYHNIFLLQLMVRFGMQCFLDNFTQHLVEAVGGYKDATPELLSPGHICRNKTLLCKKPRYSDANMKTAMSNTNTDIFSPDTSCGSELVNTPSEKHSETVESIKDKDLDNRSENELFHFESEKERQPSRSSRSKSPAESIESYTLSAQNESMGTPSPSEALSPQNPKEFTPNPFHFSSERDAKDKVPKDDLNESMESKKSNLSPNIETPKSSMFTSYLHFAEDEQKSSDDIDIRKESHKRAVKSLNLDKPLSVGVEATELPNDCCHISDMSCESLIWLAHRIGPVLTCRYITRNLLKMLTLCYIGKENLTSCEGNPERDEFDAISITNCRVVGDNNAAKVIKCLTAIVGMYGEQLIVFQYLAHMSELIACCRRRLSAPLEGGLVACLHLFKYLLPYMSDKKLMEQLQDTILKCIIHPSLRLVSSGRSMFPCAAAGRGAATRKLCVTLHALVLRLGRVLPRAPIHRFFLIFDKATGKVENWPQQESETGSDVKWSTSGEDAASSSTITGPGVESEVEGAAGGEGFLELCRDGSTAEWCVRGGLVLRRDAPPDPPCSPPGDTRPHHNLQAQDELLTVFNAELAYQCYHGFASVLGRDHLQAALHNADTVLSLCAQHSGRHAVSPPLNISSPERRHQSPSSDDQSRSFTNKPEQTYSNSFGSNVTLVGNRIDVASDMGESERAGSVANGFDVVAHKSDHGFASNRHLRGDWLIYWEHEIGRPDKENRFNLKQIKLQTFVGHSQTVKSIHCLDNESSFMSASKDKSVRLWSLRNQGDGNATSQCNWSYTGHKKGVLSLTFLESLRLAVSTDSVVHIWDPFMETVVNQLDYIKSPISIVRTLPGPSTVVVAATTDATIKIIDARCCNYTHDLKVPGATNSFIRSLCVSGWAVVTGLASGQTAAIDLRTSQLLSTTHHHHHEVLRLAAVDNKRILSSSLDQTMALWNVDNGEMIAHLKGPTEPVHCLSVYHNQLISGTTNNRIGVHTDLHQDASFSSTKLRSDTLKGVLTSMAVLPLNRLLLLGSDNGSISLIC